MTIKKSILTIGATLILVASASSQQVGGSVLRTVDFSITDMLKLSQYNYGFNTARSSAMGGAFTSLGADLSSMSINPAGLGMYRSSEFSITPEFGSSYDKYNNNRLHFAINNLGFAFNTFQGSGSPTSVTLGFGYNKLVDLNYESIHQVAMGLDNGTIATAFGEIIGGHTASNLEDGINANDFYPIEWGGILAYQSWLLNERSSGSKTYAPTGWNDHNTMTSSVLYEKSRGRVGEFTFSGGLNLDNRLYFGVTLGIQDIYQKLTSIYDERFQVNGVDDRQYKLSSLSYGQSYKLSGSGVNVKLGMIIRPVDQLRIGVAFHSPTFVTVKREYFNASMTANYSELVDNRYTHFSNVGGILEYDYDFYTPSRLMAGISYAFGNYGLLAVDYEKAWYNGIRMNDTQDESMNDAFRRDVKLRFKSADNVRVGAEIKPIPEIALRFGYAYYGSANKNSSYAYDQPTITSTENISAGVGYRIDNMSFDITYVNMKSEMSQFRAYIYDDFLGSKPNAESPMLNSQRTYDNVMMTFGVRF